MIFYSLLRVVYISIKTSKICQNYRFVAKPARNYVLDGFVQDSLNNSRASRPFVSLNHLSRKWRTMFTLGVQVKPITIYTRGLQRRLYRVVKERKNKKNKKGTVSPETVPWLPPRTIFHSMSRTFWQKAIKRRAINVNGNKWRRCNCHSNCP